MYSKHIAIAKKIQSSDNLITGNLTFGDRDRKVGILSFQRRAHKLLADKDILVCIWGFSAGKTYFGAREIVMYSLLAPGGLSWILVPAYNVGAETWTEVKKVLYSIHPDIVFSVKDDDPPTIFLTTGTKIQMKTGDDPDLLRNFKVNFLFLEEASKTKEDAWLVAWSRVAKGDGKALIMGTRAKTEDHWTEKLIESKLPNMAVIEDIATKDNRALSKQQINKFYGVYKGIYLRRELEGEKIYHTDAIIDCFKHAEHTYDHFTPTEINKIMLAHRTILVSIDPGWDKPTGVLLSLLCKWKREKEGQSPEPVGVAIGPVGGEKKLFPLKELYGRTWDITRLKQELYDMTQTFYSQYPFLANLPILWTCDPKQPNIIYELTLPWTDRDGITQKGFPVEPAPLYIYEPGQKENSIKDMYNWFYDNNILISQKLNALLTEIKQWKRKTSGKPADDYDHLIDCTRQQIATSNVLDIQNKPDYHKLLAASITEIIY